MSVTRTPITSSQSSELDLIEQLKSHLTEPLLAAVSSKLQQLALAELKIRVLEERLRLTRIEKYGVGSEKLSDAQLELLELEPGVSNIEVQAESQREEAVPATTRKRQHPGRQILPANLPRVERVLACMPEQSVCQGCGKQ